jgi:hypothetical protein
MEKSRRKPRRRNDNKQLVTKTSVHQMISSALNTNRQTKFTYNEYVFSPPLTGIIAQPVAIPVQGVEAYNSDEVTGTQGQRIGNSINPLQIDYTFTAYVSGAGTESVVRMIMFEWLVPQEHSDEQPVVGDILQVSLTSYPYNTPLNFENKSKYHILADRVFTLVTGAETQVIHHKMVFKQSHLKCKQWKMTGDSQMGTGAGIIKGGIYVMWFSDGSIETPDLETATRLLYSDAN